MPRIRIKLRWMMVAVAVIAVPLSATAEIMARQHRFQSRVGFHTTEMDLFMEDAGGLLGLCGNAFQGMSDAEVKEHIDSIYFGRGPKEHRAYRMAWQHDAMAEKYRQAAARPWFPVAADPSGLEIHTANQRSELTKKQAEMNEYWAKLSSRGTAFVVP